MKVLANGYFSDEWESTDLSKGLRSNSKSVRNEKVLTACNGMVGQEGLLANIPSLSLSSIYNDSLVVKGDFPFPQIFSTESFLVICNRSSVLEYENGNLTKKVNTVSGDMWAMIHSHDFLYLSNGLISVTRNPISKAYELSYAPICKTICNFNGQIICGNIQDVVLRHNGMTMHNGTYHHSGRLA